MPKVDIFPSVGTLRESREPPLWGQASLAPTTGLALNRNVTPHHLTESSADHEAKSGTDWKTGWLRPPGLPPIRTLDDIQGRSPQ